MSTYSSLKFELILTGDQSGQWGNTTNTNIGTAINEAIAGSVDVTFASTDVTLTLLDTNVTQSARNLRLFLTGTSIGSARTLTLGTGCQINKPYIVYNNLTDAVTVKNTSGTGISVPAGKTMWLFNNGTNVVDAVSYLSSVTLGTALAATSGGTGQSSYAVGDLLYASTTTALSKLADVATGNALISGGVTTAPSWGKIGLTTHVDGTLAATNGGTGASTTTAGDILYGAASNTWAKLAAGTTGQLLQTNGAAAPTWLSQSSIVAGSATNVAGGAANRIPYQSGAGATTFVAAPTVASTYLSWTGSAFTWTAVSPGSITGGAANQIVYQSAPSTSSFLTAPTTASTYLSWNGTTFVWTSVSPSGSTFAGDISVNGLTVGRGTASIASNTALGYQANNAITTATGITSIGYNANAGITTSIQHTAVGYEANKTITDVGNIGFAWEGNTAVGFKALTLNTGYITAYSANTAVGAAAGAGLVGGYYNTSIGAGAGPTVLGNSSVCVGIKAGYSWAGTESVLIGYQAYSQVFGSTNVGNYITAIGASTLYNATQGSSGVTLNYTTAVGRQTFYNIDPGGGANCANNTALGGLAGSNLLSGVNNTLLGYNAQASTTSASNEITLGNSSIATLRCQVTSITALSDARDKYDVEDLPVGLDFINSLKARRFKWDKRDAYFDEVENENGLPTRVAVPKDGSRKSNEWNEGFIAQEVDAAATAAGADWMNLVYKSNPEKLEMTPGKLIPVLVNAIQELAARLEALEARN